MTIPGNSGSKQLQQVLDSATLLQQSGESKGLGLQKGKIGICFDGRKVTISDRKSLAKMLSIARKDSARDSHKLTFFQKRGITAIKAKHVVAMLTQIVKLLPKEGPKADGANISSTGDKSQKPISRVDMAKRAPMKLPNTETVPVSRAGATTTRAPESQSGAPTTRAPESQSGAPTTRAPGPPSGAAASTTTSKNNQAPSTMTDFLAKLPCQAEGAERTPVSIGEFDRLNEIIAEELKSQPRLPVWPPLDTFEPPRFKNIARAKEHALLSPLRGPKGEQKLMQASMLKFTPGKSGERVIIGMQHPLMHPETAQKLGLSVHTSENSRAETFNMLWDNNITKVSNLTNTVGDRASNKTGRGPDHDYWPEEGMSFDAGGLSVKNKGVKDNGTYSVITLELRDTGSDETKTTTIFHFKKWPDHGIPVGEDAKGYKSYLNAVRAHERGTPIVVHCHAGVGRTGVHTISDVICDAIDDNPEQSPSDVIRHVNQLLWEGRSTGALQMIQTEVQYNFTIQNALDYLESKKAASEDTIYENFSGVEDPIYENVPAGGTPPPRAKDN